MDVAATLDCYLNIVGKWRWFATARAFWITLAGALVLSCCLVFYWLACFHIDHVVLLRPLPLTAVGNFSSASDFYNYTYYFLAFNKPVATNAEVYRSGAFANAVFRELISSLALLVLNGLILNQLKVVRGRKQALGGGSGKDQETQAVKSARVAERKRTHMILALSFVNICLKLPSIINYILGRIWGGLNTGTWRCFSYAVNHMEIIAYGIPFLFYYFYNTQFQKYTNRILVVPLRLVPGFSKAIENNKSRRGGTSAATHDSSTANGHTAAVNSVLA
jgi:hypothetical protein